MKFDPTELAIILEEAKRYTNSQRLGYLESGVILTFDGNTDGKEVFGTVVKISDTVFDLRQIKTARVMTQAGEIEVSGNDIIINEDEGFCSANVPSSDSSPSDTIAITVSNTSAASQVPAGTYFIFMQSYGYTTYLEFNGTIHPIPQEYIPPMDKLILNGLDGKQHALIVDASGQLTTTEVT